jgi:Tol biopolymer transport system component
VCAIAERSADGKQLIFTAFGPLQGRGRELARLDADPNNDYGWDLSPDGAHIAFVRRVPRSDGKIFLSDGAIHILSLQGGPSRELKVKGVENFRQYVDWAADGKGLFAAHPTGAETELLYVDLQGNGSVVWHTKDCEPLRGVPSPDGHHLAILCGGQYNNVWLMENFN